MIIFEDQDICICHKPTGMAVQSARVGQMDLESYLRNHFAEQGSKERIPYVGMIHRLDQPVEGVVVFAKNPKAAKTLSTQIANGKMEKKYLAVLDGVLEKKEGNLEDYLLKDGRNNISHVVQKKTPQAKRAYLEYKTLKVENGHSLVEIILGTGRHHQIRVQLSKAGAPILGDAKYSSKGKEENSVRGKGGEIALCAYSLTFYHPVTQRKVTYQIKPKGSYFQEFA